MNAADLPDSSIVVGQAANGREIVCIKDHPSPRWEWRSTSGNYVGNAFVDALIADGTARVLRVGAGE